MNRAITGHLKNALYDTALGDIKKAASYNSTIGAFILASCFIDHMAGFVYGRQTKKDDYKNFVRDYLPPIYDPSKLYEDLRCKLVHNYSEGGSYWLRANHAELHGQSENGKTIINLQNFIGDLETAFNKLMTKIKSQPSAMQMTIRRYNKIGLLCPGGLAIGKL